ncbi:hypothetical protein SAMN02745824_1603 [Parasphingorhabdus marina DSM 22363]|uniref:Uncharacterized protein n=1 Tax=Parasphingorhabdus marina DSM 22363 TaxID=1123272 RepID=A0A1N6D639_9SPHN|nr:hypothetical protein [Parasphingorhabdus marina]SIN66300.1 hypothetical protein SAMN02745824_1603 [Parasphingorhabdus marina DSM 22363]
MSKSEELSVAEFFRFGMEAANHSAALEMQRQEMSERSERGARVSAEGAADRKDSELS